MPTPTRQAQGVSDGSATAEVGCDLEDRCTRRTALFVLAEPRMNRINLQPLRHIVIGL